METCRMLSVFWISNANNILNGNAAVGGEAGIWIFAHHGKDTPGCAQKRFLASYLFLRHFSKYAIKINFHASSKIFFSGKTKNEMNKAVNYKDIVNRENACQYLARCNVASCCIIE